MFPKPRARFLLRLPAVLLALLGGSLPAQTAPDEGLSEVRKIFRDGLKAPAVEERLEAVNALVLSGLPDGIELMQEGLEATLKERRQLLARYRAVGERVDDLTRKRLHVPRKAGELSQERSRLANELQCEELVVDALRKGMGKLFAGLPEDATFNIVFYNHEVHDAAGGRNPTTWSSERARGQTPFRGDSASLCASWCSGRGWGGGGGDRGKVKVAR
jgi:hypothetical protein